MQTTLFKNGFKWMFFFLMSFFLVSCHNDLDLVDFPEQVTVSFYLEDELLYEVSVSRLSLIEAPLLDISDDGYYIGAWSLEKQHLTQWDFRMTTVKTDIKLYAKKTSLFMFSKNQNDENYTLQFYRGPSVFLDEVVVPETYLGKPVTRISYQAFSHPFAPKKIILPKTIEFIDGRAFAWPTIEEVIMPFDSNLEFIHPLAFEASNIKTFNMPDNYEIDIELLTYPQFRVTPIFSEDNVYHKVIDNVIYTKDLKTLFFYLKQPPREVYEILEGVEVISYRAFYEAKVDKVYVPDTVTILDDFAFNNSQVTEVIFGEDSALESIGNHVFNFSQLKTFTVPKHVSLIKYGTFNMSQLETIYFHVDSELSEIESYAFIYTPLLHIELPSSLERLGGAAFDLTNLNQVTLRSDVSEALVSQLNVINTLETVIIDDQHLTMKSVEGMVYAQDETQLLLVPRNNLMTTFHIDSTLTYIAPSAFYKHNHMTLLTIDVDHPTLSLKDQVIFSKNYEVLLHYPGFLKQATYTIPYGIRTVGEKAFYGHGYIYTIRVSKDVETIEHAAFMNSNVAVILFDQDIELKEIKSYAFFGSSIYELILPEGIEVMHEFAIANNLYLTRLYVPESTDEIMVGAIYSHMMLELYTDASELKASWHLSSSHFFTLFVETHPWIKP